MKQIHGEISPLIESQFPAFYREEGPLFVSFVKAYYQWLESNNNPLYYSRNLLSFKDIDTTLDQFLPYFQTMFINGVSLNGVEEKRDLIKHALDIHRTKGTIQSLRLIFRLLFNEPIEVYNPSNDILRVSHGKWNIPIYLELSPTDISKQFIGKDIEGSISGAKAFVENVVRRTRGGYTIDVAFLSNVRGQFVTNELVSYDNILADSAKVIGSLTDIEINTRGANFEIGQIVDIVSSINGIQGKARISNTGIRTGEINYLLDQGGFGYTLNANVFNETQKVFVSANVLSITSFTSSNSFVVGFDEFTTVKQPLVNVVFSSANVTFANGSLIYGANSTNGRVAGGFILSTNNTSNTTGFLLISPHSLSNVTIDTITNANTVSGSFISGEIVYQTNSSGNAAVGLIVYANSSAATIDQRFGPFNTNTLLIGNTSNCTANVVTVSTLAFNNTNFNDASITKLFANTTTNGAIVTSVTDITATGNVVGSNVSSVGVRNITNTFFADTSSRNYIFDVSTEAKAVVTFISSGDPGGFQIGGIGNTEVVYIGTDQLGANNSGNVSFLSIFLNANNSNVSSNTGYGFSQSPSANISSIINVAFAKIPLTIGSIISLTERNPGSNNTARPFSVEIEKAIASYGKREILNLGIINPTTSYKNGEQAVQSIVLPTISANVGSVSGTFNNTIREVVRQVRSDGNTVFGEIFSASVVGSNGSLRIIVSNTSNTFDTSNTIQGIYSGAVATPNLITTNNLNIQAKGIVVENSNTDVIVRRTSFTDFIINTSLVGSESGATANVISITEDISANVLGNNAIIDIRDGITNGTIESIELIDSGFFYQEGELITFLASNNQTQPTGIVVLGNQGTGLGYWKGEDGLISSDKVIQDNFYYQEYSYDIQSGLDISRYEEFIKNTVHVAGTKMFGSFNKSSIIPNNITRMEATYPKIITLNTTPISGNFTTGELVFQSNGSSNTATGYVLSYSNTLNTLQLTNTVGSFLSSNVVTGANSGAQVDTITVIINIS